MPSLRSLVVAVVAAVVLAACSGGGGAGPLGWRDLDLVVPSGWQVLDQRGDLLMLANRDLRVDDLDATPSLPQNPDANEAVAVQFTTDSARPDAWRSLVAAEGGQIESDRRIQVDGVPATSITFSWVGTYGVPTREQVVIVPSRELVILLQPVPVRGQQTGPDVYLRHVEEFQAILDSLDFGAPVEG